MSYHWLCAVPRALRACRFGLWPAAIAAVAALAPAGGCGVVTGSGSASGPSSTFAPDGSAGGSGGVFGADATTSCRASDVSTHVPTTYQSAISASGACLDADGAQVWDEFFDACLGSGKSKDRCDSFKQTPSKAACAACVLTPYTADQLGPIIDYVEFVGANVAGCIELTTARDLPCAKAVQALTDCEIGACQANCPVSDAVSLAAREACSRDAHAAGCHSYYQAAYSCRAAEADGGLAGPCMYGPFKDFYEAVVPLFCGRAAVDASAVSDARAPFDGGLATRADGGELDGGGSSLTDAGAE